MGVVSEGDLSRNVVVSQGRVQGFAVTMDLHRGAFATTLMQRNRKTTKKAERRQKMTQSLLKLMEKLLVIPKSLDQASKGRKSTSCEGVSS